MSNTEQMDKVVMAVRTIEKALLEEVGPRCPDYEPYCVVCETWSHFDAVARAVDSYLDTCEGIK